MQGLVTTLGIYPGNDALCGTLVSLSAEKHVKSVFFSNVKFRRFPYMGFLTKLTWRLTVCKMHENLTLFRMLYLDEKRSCERDI